MRRTLTEVALRRIARKIGRNFTFQSETYRSIANLRDQLEIVFEEMTEGYSSNVTVHFQNAWLDLTSALEAMELEEEERSEWREQERLKQKKLVGIF